MIPLQRRIHLSQSIPQPWVVIAAVCMLLCGCQFLKAPPEEEPPPGPPHARNQQPQALQNMKRLQGLLDQAVEQGEAGEAHADAFRKASYPVIGPSYQHPQHLHLVPSLKNQGLGPAPRY